MSCSKEDFDLCSICFADIGTEAEYIRMDHPIIYKDPVSQYNYIVQFFPHGGYT